MATTVGTEKDILGMFCSLIELDYDAIEAYQAAIDKLGNESDKTKLREFMGDHKRHVTDLTGAVTKLGGTPPTEGDAKKFLTKGKVQIMSLGGDNAILAAMKSNEEDTNIAYERAFKRDDLPIEYQDIIKNAFNDEKKHKAWLESRLSGGREVRT